MCLIIGGWGGVMSDHFEFVKDFSTLYEKHLIKFD